MSLQEVKKAGSAAHKHAVRRQLLESATITAKVNDLWDLLKLILC